MRVLLTGGTGHIGKSTTERLLNMGWEVRIIDLAEETQIEGVEYAQCNILNYDNLLKRTQGCDAVIHLAAIRSPYLAPGHEVFSVNAAGTFNVFEAAAAAGIKRVVQASSINALGAFYNMGELDPKYFPIDEQHPTSTSDPYSLSKNVVEEIGAYYWRREGISSTAFRFPGVYARGFTEKEDYLKKVELTRQTLDELVSLPEAEQRARIADAQRRNLEFRLTRPFEFKPEGEANPPFSPRRPFAEDPLLGMYIGDRYNFWTFIDERDAAQALVKGLVADYEGDHPLFANDSINTIGYDSKTLIRLFFPEVTRFTRDLPGADSLISIDAARELIGFEPEYSTQGMHHHD